MKISIALSILILVIVASLGWRDHRRLTAVRETHGKLVAEAALLGISTGHSSSAGTNRITGRGRKNREVEAKLAAVEFIKLAKQREAPKQAGGRRDKSQWMFMMIDSSNRMKALDPGQMKIVIAEILGDMELEEEMRRDLIGLSIWILANHHPQGALALLSEVSERLMITSMGRQIIPNSLGRWAKDDPMAALEWVRKNAGNFPDYINDYAKKAMIQGAATQHPALAFKLIGELDFIKSRDNSVQKIMRSAVTPEKRTAALAALRAHLATLQDSYVRDTAASQASTQLAESIARDGFKAHSKWINATPAGPTKTTSIRAYAETLSSYGQPAAAAQWAMTLPPGKDLEETLKQIHNNWQKNDPAAKETAAAFAKEHGIK